MYNHLRGKRERDYTISKTTADLIANTRTLLDEANPANWTTAEVLYQVNYAYQFVASKVMEVYEEYYFTTTPYSYSTVADQQEYTISPTLLKVERVEVNLNPSDANSQAQRATKIKLDEIYTNKDNSLLNGSPYFNVGYYLIGNQSAQKIGFLPVPQVTGTNNISVWGIDAPTDLSADADPVIIPYVDNFAQIIAKIAAANLLKKGGQEVAAANDLLKASAQDILNYQTFISERQSEGATMIEEAAFDDITLGNYLV